MNVKISYFYHKEDAKDTYEIENLKNELTHYGFNMVNHAENANIIARLVSDGDFLQCSSSHWFPR